MTFNPDPKPYIERITRGTVAWEKRRIELFTRDGFRCHWCRLMFPFKYLAPCHIKSTGAGGGDELENLRTGCKSCHGKSHMGLL